MEVKGRISIPANQYQAEFVSVEETEHQEYGAGLIWAFMVIGGKYDGQLASRTTGDIASALNSCGRMFKAVAGYAWHPEKASDTEPFVGKRFHIIVEDAPSGKGTRVASAIAVPEDTSGTDVPKTTDADETGLKF